MTTNADPAPNAPEPEAPPGLTDRVRGFVFSPMGALTLGGATALLLVVTATCAFFGAEAEPVLMPEPVPTWTPAPTFTPTPGATATPQPIADLRRKQEHYQEYRFFHFVEEYVLCHRASVLPPIPTPAPIPVEGQDAPPTATPVPTQVPGAFPRHHRPLAHDATEAQLEDNALADVDGAVRWLIERYDRGQCHELTQFGVFPGRLVWLNRHAVELAPEG